MVFGCAVISSRADRRCSSPLRCRPRRRSPSVTTPTSSPRGVDHAGDAEPLLGDLQHRLRHRRVGAHQRQLVAVVHELVDAAAGGGRGCRRGAARRSRSALKPLRSSSATASASPSASVAVVLAVGARPSGHASSGTLTSSTTSAARARVEVGRAGDGDHRQVVALEHRQQADHLLRLAAVGDARAPRRPCRARRGRRAPPRRRAGRTPACRCWRGSRRSCGRSGPTCRCR